MAASTSGGTAAIPSWSERLIPRSGSSFGTRITPAGTLSQPGTTARIRSEAGTPRDLHHCIEHGVPSPPVRRFGEPKRVAAPAARMTAATPDPSQSVPPDARSWLHILA